MCTASDILIKVVRDSNYSAEKLGIYIGFFGLFSLALEPLSLASSLSLLIGLLYSFSLFFLVFIGITYIISITLVKGSIVNTYRDLESISTSGGAG